MKRVWIIMGALFLSVLPARAEWVDLSKGLNELTVEALAAHPKDPNILFAGTDKRVYRTLDGGASWKSVLILKGADQRVNFIYVDPIQTNLIYVCTDSGVYGSLDQGKKWASIFKAMGKENRSVFCVSRASESSSYLWVGTGQGLFKVDAKTNSSFKIDTLPAETVYSVVSAVRETSSFFLVTTDKGIFKSRDEGVHWERVFVIPKEEIEAEETTLEQFDIEEFTRPSLFSNVVYWNAQDRYYAATTRGILESSKDASTWALLKNQVLPDQKINFIARTANTLCVATDRGVFQWDPSSLEFKELYKGLESTQVRTLTYSASGDYLLAGTRKGIFKFSHPELTMDFSDQLKYAGPTAAQVLARFRHEPSIREVQSMAIQYAEVHPEKIESWRKAAAKKAIFPTLSFDTDFNKDKVVDLDRGGTNDPDKFIIGPEEESLDWSVGVSWDLGDLVWNDDQTSIDTRSRLMVQLRDDILNEVTHLYYERRRLQVEMAMAPMRDLPIQIEKEIRLQELTAGIDALTGEYFSKKIEANLEKKKAHELILQ